MNLNTPESFICSKIEKSTELNTFGDIFEMYFWLFCKFLWWKWKENFIDSFKSLMNVLKI